VGKMAAVGLGFRPESTWRGTTRADGQNLLFLVYS
jgi:hypothetical protein